MTLLIADHKVRIAKAKQQAVRWMPYLNAVFGPMQCIATEKCPRAAVDKWGRMYYNPTWVMQQDARVLAYVILHETLHVVLSHCQRTVKLVPDGNRQRLYVANVAQDLCIQQTLAREIGEFEPENIVRYEDMTHIPGITRNKTSEQYFEALIKYYEEQRQRKEPWSNQPNDESNEDESEEMDSTDEDGEEDEDFDADSEDGSESDEDGDEQDSDESGSGEGGESDKDGETSESDSGSGDGELDADADPQSQSEGDGGTGSSADNSQSGGNGEGTGEGQCGDEQIDTDWLPDFGDVCNPEDAGSNSDGMQKEWEEEPTLADIANNESRLREVEQCLEKINPSVGSGAGNIRQTLKARLHPMPDPFDQLKQVVARSIASPLGSPELTYRKWPRRQLPGKCRLRGVQRYTPEATILLDTSGSMLSSDVQQRALAIVAKGISRLQNPRIVCCDGAIQSAKRVASMHNFHWDGGGGTDMARGLIYVDETYKPDSIVIITDGYTDWPRKKLRAKVICALCAEGWANKVPSWITTVHLYRKGAEYVL